MPDDSFLQRVHAFVQRYVSLLDRREYETWITLFAEVGYYEVLRNIELLEGDNVVLVGENMQRLSGRISSGVTRDLRRSVHCLGWTIADVEKNKATASFALWLDGRPSTAGRYELDFASQAEPLKLLRCTVVLDTIDILDTIYLPI